MCVSNENIFSLIFSLLFKEFWLVVSNFCFHGFCDDKDYLNAVCTARENVQNFTLYICSGFPVVARDLPKLWIHREFPISYIGNLTSATNLYKKENNNFFFLLPHHLRNNSYYHAEASCLESISVVSGRWETWCIRSIISATVANNVVLRII